MSYVWRSEVLYEYNLEITGNANNPSNTLKMGYVYLTVAVRIIEFEIKRPNIYVVIDTRIKQTIECG